MKPAAYPHECPKCGHHGAEVFTLNWVSRCSKCLHIFHLKAVPAPITRPVSWIPTVGENVCYYGPCSFEIKNPGKVLSVENNHYLVRFSVMESDHVQLSLPLSDLFPSQVIDDDLAEMCWDEVRQEAQKLRTAFKYILSQRGDDTCWRDFYVTASRVMPPPWSDHALRLSLPSKPVMMHNCDSFTTQLCQGTPENYTPESPDEIIKTLQARIKEIEMAPMGVDEKEYPHKVTARELRDAGVAVPGYIPDNQELRFRVKVTEGEGTGDQKVIREVAGLGI